MARLPGKTTPWKARQSERLFGNQTSCGSSKPATGHCLGAAGAIEAGLCWLILSGLNREKRLPPHYWDGEADSEMMRLGFVTLEHPGLSHYNTVLVILLLSAATMCPCSLVIREKSADFPYPVETLLPHSQDMVLLDRVMETGEDHIVVELEVRDDGLFSSLTIPFLPGWDWNTWRKPSLHFPVITENAEARILAWVFYWVPATTNARSDASPAARA